MSGETNLSILLKTMRPKHIVGDFVFCTLKDFTHIPIHEIVLFFKEEEGYTLILRKELADILKIDYAFVAAWLMLTVHSALEGVGLTAAFSTALAKAGISCNVVAGFYHDHIFVGKADAARAMAVLEAFSE
jgi:uncharacterized protein